PPLTTPALHDALPISMIGIRAQPGSSAYESIAAVLPHGLPAAVGQVAGTGDALAVLWISPDEFLAVSVVEKPALLATLESALGEDRKSTRLNSSHVSI